MESSCTSDSNYIVISYFGGTGLGVFVAYFVVLFYHFVGVGMIADIFMTAIERITSKQKQVTLPDGEVIEVYVWNNAVANLTLMALGSSAPEILLAVIEIIGNNFEAGALGPGTIVGSAAFNLFVIIAVCQFIPEPKAIKRLDVHGITAIWSILAYLWLFIILSTSSPNIVSVWEGVATLLCFPALVIMAFSIDRGYLEIFGVANVDIDDIEVLVKDGINDVGEHHARKEAWNSRIISQIKSIRKSQPNLNTEEVYRMAFERVRLDKDRRVNNKLAIRRRQMGAITGRLDSQVIKKRSSITQILGFGKGSLLNQVEKPQEPSVFHWMDKEALIKEDAGTTNFTVYRSGGNEISCSVVVKVKEGTAKAGKAFLMPYTDDKGILLNFLPGEMKKQVNITIINTEEYEEDEYFTLNLENPCGVTLDGHPCRLGVIRSCKVIIQDVDSPGKFGFEKGVFTVREDAGEAKIKVLRSFGYDGDVFLNFMLSPGSAASPKDYLTVSGRLEFQGVKHGEVPQLHNKEQIITFPIFNDEVYEKNKFLILTLWSSEKNVQFTSHQETRVEIIESYKFKGFIDMMRKKYEKVKRELQSEEEADSDWTEQFRLAFHPSLDNKSEEIEGEGRVTISPRDWMSHVIFMPWKIWFAFCPPPSLWGGWGTFWVAIIFIGIVTMFIGDLATGLGCSIGLKDEVTAITFVALGTSLPDTFASRLAAIEDDNADASIINVTGSNAVNVFLGIGIAWLVASSYHASNGNDFIVEAGSIGFSVLIFVIFACTTFAVLLYKRRKWGAELGGQGSVPTAFLLIILWFSYVILTSLEAYGIMEAGL